MNDDRVSALVSAPSLAEECASARPPVLLDVRWVVGSPALRNEYLAAHIPDAVFVDLDEDLADPPSTRGRHPLPDPARLQQRLRDWGVHPESSVVAYDGRTSVAAARAWWVLRWAGLTDVRVLNGGFAAWVGADLPVATGDGGDPGDGTVEVRSDSLPLLDAAGAAHLSSQGRLLDVRAAERFRGEIEPIDPIAGHIPGAINLPATEMITDSGMFKAAPVLSRMFAAAGVDGSQAPVGAYCGSGVTASQSVLALHEAGLNALLYPGSWSEWIADPQRPIATGAD